MKVKVFRNSITDIIAGILPAIILTAGIAVIILLGLRQVETSSRAEGRRLLEDGIKNAVIRHYAAEGNYPPSISFIEENYGVYIDRSRYAVDYNIFAPNIIPVITVIEL